MSINPYEPPQSSLDSESLPQAMAGLPTKEERPPDPSFLVLKILLVIALLFVEVTLGLLLFERLLCALGMIRHSEIEILDGILPWNVAVFIGIGGFLWWLRKPSE